MGDREHERLKSMSWHLTVSTGYPYSKPSKSKNIGQELDGIGDSLQSSEHDHCHAK